jgi:metal-responsive CopG/Arc/MetJ family transcriptional regulator
MTRINISISDEIIQKVNKYCGLTYSTRSGLILKALENYFPEIEKKILEERRIEAFNGIFKIREKIGNSLKNWNSTEELRNIRNARWMENNRWPDITSKKMKNK